MSTQFQSEARSALANILREQHPALCDRIDALLRAGERPEQIQKTIDRVAGRGHVTAGLVNSYLREVDTDYRAREERREARG